MVACLAWLSSWAYLNWRFMTSFSFSKHAFNWSVLWFKSSLRSLSTVSLASCICSRGLISSLSYFKPWIWLFKDWITSWPAWSWWMLSGMESFCWSLHFWHSSVPLNDSCFSRWTCFAWSMSLLAWSIIWRASWFSVCNWWFLRDCSSKAWDWYLIYSMSYWSFCSYLYSESFLLSNSDCMWSWFAPSCNLSYSAAFLKESLSLSIFSSWNFMKLFATLA